MKKAKGTPKQNLGQMDQTGHFKHKRHMSKPNMAPQTQSKVPANKADASLKSLRGY